MAQAATRKSRPRAKGRSRKKVKGEFPLKQFLSFCLLAVFFFLTIGVLTYVIFFRMVVAAELGQGEHYPMFEEPIHPAGILYGNGTATQTEDPKFAILIDDMGHSQEIGEQLIELDLHLSFSFLPHAPYTAELQKAAYREGKTVLLHQPMQPRDSNWNPGPGALYVDEAAEQKRIFLENYSAVSYATGVNNHMGSLYTENIELMRKFLGEIARRNLFYVDSFTSADSVGYYLAKEAGVPTTRRDLFLDNVLDIGRICQKIEELIKTARGRGSAVGIAHPHQQTYDALQTCLQSIQLPAQLVPITELLE